VEASYVPWFVPEPCGSVALFLLRPTWTHQTKWYTWLLAKFQPRSKPHSIGKTFGHSKHNWTSLRHHWNSPPGCKCLDIIARATKTLTESRHRGPLLFDSQTGSKNSADVSIAYAKLPCLTHMKPNREKIEAEDLVKERLPLTKWELTPKEKEDFDRVMRLIFDAASILRYDLELGEDAIGKTLKELADWATN
jgi:hypothetical protein